ncbi:hypothetical protein ACE1B6_06350 [Aerosakkonemataceae cyanobacterium BLCC-F154]|uniref:Uncharacterized protein n=1 Tax=Floridaenema fluviatile BLCC-F154 TaxID=3153640 RepID=A0ABV4Y7U7_9CYAN
MLTKTYKKSKHCQVVDGENGKFMVYHSLFNQPREVSQSIVDFLNLFEEVKTLDNIGAICEGDIHTLINIFENLYLLVSHEVMENH